MRLLDLVAQLYQDPFGGRSLWQFFVIRTRRRAQRCSENHHAATDGIGMGYRR
jgi:hypothetical protein